MITHGDASCRWVLLHYCDSPAVLFSEESIMRIILRIIAALTTCTTYGENKGFSFFCVYLLFVMIYMLEPNLLQMVFRKINK